VPRDVLKVVGTLSTLAKSGDMSHPPQITAMVQSLWIKAYWLRAILNFFHCFTGEKNWYTSLQQKHVCCFDWINFTSLSKQNSRSQEKL